MTAALFGAGQSIALPALAVRPVRPVVPTSSALTVAGDPELSPSAVSSDSRRFVTVDRRERWSRRFGADHAPDLAQHLDTRRQEKSVVVNGGGEFPRKQRGLFVGKVQIHIGNIARSANR
jgi:hypothetical protein